MAMLNIEISDHCQFKEGDWFEYRDKQYDGSIRVRREEFLGYMVYMHADESTAVEVMYDSGDYYEHHSFVDIGDVIGKASKPT